MEYLTENIIIKNITRESEGYINVKLLDYLTPNEFYIYTYLINAPKDFSPTHDKIGVLLNLRSRTSTHSVLNRLKHLGLLSIEKLGNVYIWAINDVVIEGEREKVKQINDREITLQTTDDRRAILEEMDILEASLDFIENDEYDETLEKIFELRMKLQKGGIKDE